MKRLFLLAVAFVLFAGFVAFEGCQSTSTASSATTMPDKTYTYMYVQPVGNGAPFIVAYSTSDPDNVMVMSRPGTTMDTACKEAAKDSAKEYSLTGHLDEVCKITGAHRYILTVNSETFSSTGHQ